MSLHNDIMNLQVDPYIKTLPSEVSIVFKNGHKVARHAAAELSCKYESAFEEALEALQSLSEKADDDNVKRFASYCLDRIKIILEE